MVSKFRGVALSYPRGSHLDGTPFSNRSIELMYFLTKLRLPFKCDMALGLGAAERGKSIALGRIGGVERSAPSGGSSAKRAR